MTERNFSLRALKFYYPALKSEMRFAADDDDDLRAF